MAIAEAAAWGIGGLFLRTFIKAGGDKIADAGKTLVNLLGGALTDALAEDGAGALKEMIAALRLPSTATRAIGSDYSVVDLAGIAWAQCLLVVPLDVLDRTFREKDGRKLARQLTPVWFVDAMIESQTLSEIDLDADIKRGLLSEDSLDKMAASLSAAALQTLELDPPIDDSAIRAILALLRQNAWLPQPTKRKVAADEAGDERALGLS